MQYHYPDNILTTPITFEGPGEGVGPDAGDTKLANDSDQELGVFPSTDNIIIILIDRVRSFHHRVW